MNCVPGMSCFQNTVGNSSACSPHVFISCGCLPTQINSANVIYTGNNLPNSGINTGDNLTQVLAKIDALL